MCCHVVGKVYLSSPKVNIKKLETTTILINLNKQMRILEKFGSSR